MLVAVHIQILLILVISLNQSHYYSLILIPIHYKNLIILPCTLLLLMLEEVTFCVLSVVIECQLNNNMGASKRMQSAISITIIHNENLISFGNIMIIIKLY